MAQHVSIQTEDFDVADEISALTHGRTDTGAIVTFTGCVRADDGMTALILEHYPAMTEREIEKHVVEAQRRWPLTGVRVIHRIGTLKPGDNIVLVVTASSHRRAAFESADFLMDYLKTQAPFWKQEERGGARHWVEAKASDDDAAKRWT